MSELRWILLALGLLLIAGIYLLGRRRRSGRRRGQPETYNQGADEELLNSLHAQRGEADDAELGEAVHELDQLLVNRFGGDEPDLDRCSPRHDGCQHVSSFEGLVDLQIWVMSVPIRDR